MLKSLQDSVLGWSRLYRKLRGGCWELREFWQRHNNDSICAANDRERWYGVAVESEYWN